MKIDEKVLSFVAWFKIVVSLAQIGQISAVNLKELIVDTILPKFTEIGFDVSGAIIILPMVLYTRRSYAEASYNFKQFYNYARRKKPVKIAFGLANKVLYSSNLDKSNVRLVDTVFSDKEIAGLEFYAKHDDFCA